MEGEEGRLDEGVVRGRTLENGTRVGRKRMFANHDGLMRVYVAMTSACSVRGYAWVQQQQSAEAMASSSPRDGVCMCAWRGETGEEKAGRVGPGVAGGWSRRYIELGQWDLDLEEIWGDHVVGQSRRDKN